MDSVVDTWLCSYALVMVIFSYIVYSLISIDFELQTIDNDDVLIIFSDDLSEIVIIVDIEESY